ncbi:hypothetical protein [Streptomyces sp. NBC_01180]|uniref:hypothetical protein n=1 Tax=Streptomyces sp. NBC_01180 TaxID=2903763 RepID=UPI00386ED7E7|nr:hypothetical protein OG708_08940 [Streptomyces sp. NBC_01180]
MNGEIPKSIVLANAKQEDILREIKRERDAQDAIFGVQDLPDGTGPDRLDVLGRGMDTFNELADAHREACDIAFKYDYVTFRHVFLEEVYEAMAEKDPAKLRAELIQAIAVGVKWVESIDRRETNV